MKTAKDIRAFEKAEAELFGVMRGSSNAKENDRHVKLDPKALSVQHVAGSTSAESA